MRHTFTFSLLLLMGLLLQPLTPIGAQQERAATKFISPAHQFRSQAIAESGRSGGMEMLRLEEPVCQLRTDEQAARTHVQPPKRFQREQQGITKASDCGMIEVTYLGFEAFPQALASFQYAVDIWESELNTIVPVRVIANFVPLGPGILGSAGPTFIFRDIPNAVPGTWYGAALADQIVGVDLAPGEFDIAANFSSTFGWYFGRDGNPPPGTYDFATVVLHELGHGLGFFGSTNAVPDPILGIYGFEGFPTIYDGFIENGAGTTLADIAAPGVVSAELGAFLQSGDLFNNSPQAVAANGGIQPAVYAPLPFRRGSSFSHWDEATFPPGTPQSLMTPFLSFQEAIHDPGTATIGMFKDHGWNASQDCEAPPQVDDTKNCDITGVSFDPLAPDPICDVDGDLGPPGSHAIFLRIEGIDPLNQPVDRDAYEVKIKGKVYPIADVGYDSFEGELYLYLLVGGIPSDGKKNLPVKVTLKNGCVAVAPKLYTAPRCPTALEKTAPQVAQTDRSVALVDLEIFPNPSSGLVRIASATSGELQVVSGVGQLLHRSHIEAGTSLELNLSHLETGMYTIRVVGKDESSVRRVVLNR